MSSAWESDPLVNAPPQESGNIQPAWMRDAVVGAPVSRTIGDVAGDIGISALKGAISVPEAVIGLADIPAGGRIARALESAGYRPKEAKQILDNLYSESQKAANRTVSDAEGFVETAKAALENPSVIAHGALEALPAMGAGGVVGKGVLAAAPKVAPLAAAAFGEGAVGAGMASANIREEGGTLSAKQSGAALTTGVLTGGLSILGGKVAQKFGLADVDQLLVQASTSTAARKNIVQRTLEGAVAEGVFEELPQSIQEQVLQNYATDRPLDESVDQAAVLGLLTGGVMGAGANAMSSNTAARPAWADDPEIAVLPAPSPFTVNSEGVVDTGTQVANAEPINPDAVAQQHPAYPNDRLVAVPALPAPAAIPVSPEGRAIMPGQQDEFAAQLRQQQAEQVAAQHPAYARPDDEAPAQPLADLDAMQPVDMSGGYEAQQRAERLASIDSMEALDLDDAAPPQAPSVAAKPSIAAAQEGGSIEESGATEPVIEAQEKPLQSAGIDDLSGEYAHQNHAGVTAVVSKTEKGYQVEWAPDDVQEFRGKRAAEKLQSTLAKERYALASKTSATEPKIATAPEDANSSAPALNAIQSAKDNLADLTSAESVTAASALDAGDVSPIDDAAHEAATSPSNDLAQPTPAQIEAGNYRKGHVALHGLNITIENPRGSERSGKREDGSTWRHTLSDHYGYVKRTTGGDGEQVDVYVGPKSESEKVFVIDQVNQKDGSWDEHKVMLGFDNRVKAVNAYRSNFDKGWKVGKVTPMSMAEFKEWLKGDTTKPLATQAAKAPTQPKRFVARPDGAFDFGEISVEQAKAIGRQAGKIRLEEGNSKYGLQHIEAAHGKQIRGLGYPDAAAFVASVASNFNQIWKADAGQLLTVVRSDGEHDVMFIQLSPAPSGDYYRVNTAFPARQKEFEQKRGMAPLWSRSEPKTLATEKQPLFADQSDKNLGSETPNAQGRSGNNDATPTEEKSKSPGSAMFSLRDNRNAASRENSPISKTDAHGVIARFNAGRRLGNNGDIRLVESFSDLPGPIQQAAYEHGANPDDIEGVFHNGTVYLVRNLHANGADLERTLFHEAYGHYGLRGLFGKAVTQKMNQLYAAIGGSKGLNEIAQRYDVSLHDYAASMFGIDADTRNAILAEELLAHIAQDQRPSIARKAKEIIGAIRAWLRERGLASLAKFNDFDIMYLLKRARQVVETGSGAGEGTRFLFGEKVTMFSRRKRQADPPDTDTERAALHKLGLAPTRRRTVAEVIQEAKNFEWREALSDIKARQYEGWIDGLSGLRRAEAAVGKGVAAGDYQNSAYVGATLATGIADVMHAVTYYGAPQWNEGVLQYKPGTRGLMEILAELKGDELTKWLGWMGGNRARELMSQGRENNLTEPEIRTLTGMAKGNEAKFERTRQEYLKINNAMLDVAQEAGLVTAESRAAWQSEWYVPFYRAEEADDGEITLLAPRSKRGLSHQKSGIQQLLGGTSATNDLLSNILHNWLRLTDASLKNSAMLKAVDVLKGTEYMTAVDENLGEKDVVRVMRDGKPQYFRVNEPSVLRAVQHLGMRGSDSSLMQAGRWFKRLLTTGVTAAPDFILRNFIRDAAQAWAINPDGFNFGRDSLRGLQTAFREDPVYRELMFAGASFQGGFIHGSDPEAAAQMIRRALKTKGYGDGEIKDFLDSTILTAGKGWSALQKGWEHYREIGDKVENSNRVATYMRALEAGKGAAQAAFEAKDLMDFSRRGNFKALVTMTDLVPFLNARLQGLDKLARTGLKSNKSRMIFAGNMAKIIAWSMLLAWLNKDDERYKAIPDWDKDAYWHFFIGDHHFRLPKPFEIGLIAGTIPERMLNAWVFGTQTTKTLVDSVMRNLYGTLNINPIPQALLPVLEANYMNKSVFFQTPIENAQDQKVMPAQRYDANTSETMKQLGSATGMSPKKLEYLWQGYTGSIGAYALGAVDMLIRNAGNAPAQPSLEAIDLPVVKAFYRGSEPPRQTQYTTDLYNRLHEVNEILGSVKKMQKEGDISGARELIEENRTKLRVRPLLDDGSEALADLRKRQAAIMRDRTLTPEVKRAQLNKVLAEINRIAARVSERTDQAFAN